MTTLAEYLEWPGEHFSVLKHILTSPRAYRDARDRKVDSDALRLGRAGHCAILEPHRFERDFVPWDARTDSGRRAPRNGSRWETFQAEHAGQDILPEDDYHAALAMARAVREHPLASEILGDPTGRAEVAIRWTRLREDSKMKARVDWVTATRLVELKGCEDPSLERFPAAAARYRYPLQLAIYRSALHSVGLTRRRSTIIAVQNRPPFDVVVYSVPEVTMAVGDKQLELALAALAMCRDEDRWPGMAPAVEHELILPAWAGGDAGITFGDEPMTFGGGA